MKSIKLKISPKKIVIYVYAFSFLLATVTLIGTAYFLYNNFYKVITQSEELVILRQQIAIETVNIKKFDEIMKRIEVKTSRNKTAKTDPVDDRKTD